MISDKKRNVAFILVALITLILLFMIGGVQNTVSFKDGNANETRLPNEAAFKKELKHFFDEKYGYPTEIELEILRKHPTQTGVSLPKFYLWVAVLNNKQVLEQGAVRLAQYDSASFDITHYVKLEDIRDNLENFGRVFPESVADSIRKKL